MQELGRFPLISKLATGGTAEVWLARNPLGRLIALKLLLPHLSEDPDFVSRFVGEAKGAVLRVHPNIVSVFDMGQLDGRYYLAMELVRGADLHHVIGRAAQNRRPIPHPAAVRIAMEICKGLHCVHTLTNYVHGLVSPAEVRIGFDGCVKLLDTTAVTSRMHARELADALRGRFTYMSPELVQTSAHDARADVFSVGLVLYELLTGVSPFRRDDEMATISAVLACVIPAPSPGLEVPAELVALMMRALARQQSDRYLDAAHFAAALERYLERRGEIATAAQLAEVMAELFPDRQLLIQRLVGGEAGDEPVAAFLRDDGTVTLENEKTGVRWFITPEDTLVAHAHRLPLGGGVSTCLDFTSEETGEQRVANFLHTGSPATGPTERVVVEFVQKVAAAAGCRVDHQERSAP